EVVSTDMRSPINFIEDIYSNDDDEFVSTDMRSPINFTEDIYSNDDDVDFPFNYNYYPLIHI
ncbi:hypothetical protein J6590_106083, partial [Homalodisca vitripennis]